jgi:O-antigen/teichoic acid export membrane protein
VLFSLPYYLNTFATTAYGKLDVTLLALAGSGREVGWYGAASAIAGLSLLVTPLIGWVLMPTLARAAARSHHELFARIRRSLELILTVAIPASLFISLAADLALRILAPTFVVTYVATMYAITLLMLDRPWTLTAISAGGLVVNVLLNLALVRPSMALFGDGGGGAGCALAMLGTELFVTGAMVSIVGRRAFDGRALRVVAKTLLACLIVVFVDRLAAPIGWARLVLDAAVYLIAVIASGALRAGEVAGVVKEALRGRAGLGSPRSGGAPASAAQVEG